jgi:hypothetical protein
MVAFTSEESIENRIEYLASLPRAAREMWYVAAHECWLMDRLNENSDAED